MIPYFQYTVIPVGPVRIQVWGLFVALGMLAATVVGARTARARGLDGGKFVDLAAWAIVGALVGSRLGYALFYAPAPFLADPLRVFKVWDGGMSSIGGFIGALVAVALFCRVARLPFLKYAETAAFVLPLGQGIGRIGCFFIHDHPGILSNSFLAVQYPGGARLDHGLLLSLFGFALFGLFLLLRPVAVRHKTLFYLPLYMIVYGIVRFWLDTYRAWGLPVSDARYFGYTPAQYGMIVLIIVGVALALRHGTFRRSSSSDPHAL